MKCRHTTTIFVLSKTDMDSYIDIVRVLSRTQYRRESWCQLAVSIVTRLQAMRCRLQPP